MVNMKTAKCSTCGGLVLKLSGSLSKLCHNECTSCRVIREEHEELERQEAQADERRPLENAEMERHFERHPHG